MSTVTVGKDEERSEERVEEKSEGEKRDMMSSRRVQMFCAWASVGGALEYAWSESKYEELHLRQWPHTQIGARGCEGCKGAGMQGFKGARMHPCLSPCATILLIMCHKEDATKILF